MFVTKLRHRFRKTVWGVRNAPSRGMRTTLRVARTLTVLVRDASDGQLTLRAMGLVYTTLLSLVPLLALSFSVLKAFGVHNQIEPMLRGVLAPLGESGGELTQRIIGFIANMNVGVLGSVGLALLLYTSLSLIQKIEESFNYIWHVTIPRPFGERFSRYLSLLLVGPILVFAALGVTASVMNADIVGRALEIEAFGWIAVAASRFAPYLLVIGAFTFAYYFIPNTRVRPAAALLGGATAGIAWQSAGWAFAAFAATSGQYTAIYSGFAVLILFFIWLYLSWLILLFGASIAFYYQHPEYLLAEPGEPRLANRTRERLALGAMSIVAGNFLAGRLPPVTDELARQLGVPAHAVQVILDAVERHRLLVRTDDNPPAYLPARDPASIPLGAIIAPLRQDDDDEQAVCDFAQCAAVNDVLARIDSAYDAALADLDLAAIAVTSEAGAAPQP